MSLIMKIKLILTYEVIFKVRFKVKEVKDGARQTGLIFFIFINLVRTF